LQATVEWSYALLGEAEQRLFDALGVFPASFDADAAVAVGAAAGLDRWDVLDGLTALVGQCMLAEEEGPDRASRYRLLETMRAYARQHLTAAQRGRLARAHARFYAAFAERAGPEVWGPAQLDWLRRIRAERDNLDAAVTWALALGGPAPRLAFRIVTALLRVAHLSPVLTRGWAEACLTRLDACPPELRAPVLAAAAYNATGVGDVPLAQRLAEQVLAEPASADPLTSVNIRATISAVYLSTGQPERAIGLARELREEAADRGLDEIFVGFSLYMEALGWTSAGDHAAARQPAMEAAEIARRVRNAALSAGASWGAAQAIWRSEPQAALLLIEDSLALSRAGAHDGILDPVLAAAAVIRARTGDLPGALAALQEAALLNHADGMRVNLGNALRIGAGILARLGEAGPAAVLSGASAAHFPGSVSAWYELMVTDQAEALARHALGEAAYDAAAGRGAAMDEDEVVRYAVGEFQRVAALLAEPDARVPEAPPVPASEPRPQQ
jgi:hypothetical protein